MREVKFILYSIFILITLIGCGASEENNKQSISDSQRLAAAKTALTFDTFKASNSSENNITSNLSLITSLENVYISWWSSDFYYISDFGNVFKDNSDHTVVLTATLFYGSYWDTKDFSLTVKAMSEAEMTTHVNAVKELITFDTIKGSNTSEGIILNNLTLVNSLEDVDISWSSSDTSYITNFGVINQGVSDHTVVLTATLSYGSYSDTKNFSMTIKAMSDADMAAHVNAVKELITFDTIKGSNYSEGIILNNLTLVNSLENVDISWSSSDTSYISDLGNVFSDDYSDHTVVLTATLSYGSYSDTKNFSLTVKAMSEAERLEVLNIYKEVMTFDIIKGSNSSKNNILSGLFLYNSLGDIDISWSSSNTSYISNSGLVTGDSLDHTVILTATFIYGSYSDTKEFTLIVKAETGEVPTLVVVMNWNDYLETDASIWSNKIFGSGRSVKTWFEEATDGVVSVYPVNETSGTTNDGIIMVDMNKNHPGNSNEEFKLEIKTALENSEVVANVDFAVYDIDGDGALQRDEIQIVLVVAGGSTAVGDSESSSIWPHAHGFYDESETVIDGVKIADFYSNGWYARIGANQGDHKSTIGVIIHELGHSRFDLGDYYDASGMSSGLGNYDIMSGGSYASKLTDTYEGETPTQFSAFNRIDMGIAELTTVTKSATTTIKCSSNEVIKLQTTKLNEYFLIECRDTSKSNSDMGMQGGNWGDYRFGEDNLFTLVSHVDTNKITRTITYHVNAENGVQTDSNHYGVRIVEKDESILMTSEYSDANYDDVYLVGDIIESNRIVLYDGITTGYNIEIINEDKTNRTMTIKITK